MKFRTNTLDGMFRSLSLFMVQKNVANAKCDAVIVIGCVIQGEKQNILILCEGVTQGIKDLNVQSDIPVIFCVLTDNTMQQSIDRSGGIHGNKGTEALQL
jgi:6,7-dimethyl-8-ribityllumazine synthase